MDLVPQEYMTQQILEIQGRLTLRNAAMMESRKSKSLNVTPGSVTNGSGGRIQVCFIYF